jgi:hypothetical protein
LQNKRNLKEALHFAGKEIEPASGCRSGAETDLATTKQKQSQQVPHYLQETTSNTLDPFEKIHVGQRWEGRNSDINTCRGNFKGLLRKHTLKTNACVVLPNIKCMRQGNFTSSFVLTNIKAQSD